MSKYRWDAINDDTNDSKPSVCGDGVRTGTFGLFLQRSISRPDFESEFVYTSLRGDRSGKITIEKNRFADESYHGGIRLLVEAATTYKKLAYHPDKRVRDALAKVETLASLIV